MSLVGTMSLVGAMSTPFINVRGQRTNMVRRSTPIAAGFEDCLQLFEQLVSAMEADSTTWKPAEVVPLKDDFSKLKAWGNETGASSRSLDHALRKASKLQQQVSELLDELRENTQRGMFVASFLAILRLLLYLIFVLLFFEHQHVRPFHLYCTWSVSCSSYICSCGAV